MKSFPFYQHRAQYDDRIAHLRSVTGEVGHQTSSQKTDIATTFTDRKAFASEPSDT